MLFEDLLTNDAVLAEVGRRLERDRLQRNRSQTEMADEAGISRATLQRLERGKSVQTMSLVKLLRALGRLSALDVALPETVEVPIAELEREHSRTRRRARGRRGRSSSRTADEPWRWGDEPEAAR